MNFKYGKNRIYLDNEKGECIAEITFRQVSDDKVNISHTYVDKSLRGQGVADKLVRELVTYLRENNIKAMSTCSYATDWFTNHPEYNDLYR